MLNHQLQNEKDNAIDIPVYHADDIFLLVLHIAMILHGDIISIKVLMYPQKMH